MIVDFSHRHVPVSTLFEQPTSRAQWDALRLSNEEVDFFQENGYVVGGRLLDDDQIETLRGEVTELANPDHPAHELFYEFHSNESDDPATVLFHALGAWRIGQGLHDILWHPRMLVAASQLLGGAVRFWHDQLFCKPPRHGGVVAWHQDYSYWTRTVPLAHLTCWIGLDDADEQSGCVQYIPGSHRWNLLPITGLAGDMHAIREVLSDEQWEAFRPVKVELRRGECVFHHALTIHGSEANRSDHPRRAVVVNMVRDGVVSDSNEPLLAGVPVVPLGEPLGGQFFPLLFDPESIE
ncbi:MAG: phytanoyl-CoA dioxygenase family protein [Planctomycetales bacterium]|nr:phytanoyl-CoA dioxygenase family protein [Planctomycetales bacterium]